MDQDMFKKLRVKPGMSASMLHAPEGYPQVPDAIMVTPGNQADFVHLFVASRAEFEQRIAGVVASVKQVW